MANYKTFPDQDGFWDEIHIVSDAINGYCVVEVHTNGDLSSYIQYELTFEEEKELAKSGFFPVDQNKQYVTLLELIDNVPPAFYKWLSKATFPYVALVTESWGGSDHKIVFLPETIGTTATAYYDGWWSIEWFKT